MGIFREFQAKASVKSLGFPSPLFSVWTMYVHNTDQRGNSLLWITVLLQFCDCNHRMLHCIFSKIRGKKKKKQLFGFSQEGLCWPWLTVPILLSRATCSSCSTTTGTPRWCPCGCAGCWRSGGQPRGRSELGWLTATHNSPALRTLCRSGSWLTKNIF